MRKLITAATILVPTAAFAGGYIIPDETARELALSQAAVADETGPEAIFLNTAALAGQEGLAISVSGELLRNDTSWSDPTLGSASVVVKNSFPPSGGISYGGRLANGMGWGVGIGAGVPGGGSLVWPNGWQGQEFIQTVTQQVFRFAAGGAFQPFPCLKIGASFIQYQAEEELHQSINYLDHFGDAGLGLAGGASTFGVAGEFKMPGFPLTVAATYKHRGTLDLTGHAHFTAVPPAFTSLLHDQGVSEHLTVPNEFYFGAAYEVVPNVKLMGAWSFEHWLVYKTDTFVGDSGFTVVVPRNYDNAQVFRFGGEWEKPKFLPALTLRAGFLRSLSPQPTNTISPSLSDGDSWAVSVGAGYNILPDLRVDVGYQHAIFDAVTASGTEAFPGTYKTSVDLVSVGLNWRLFAHHPKD